MRKFAPVSLLKDMWELDWENTMLKLIGDSIYDENNCPQLTEDFLKIRADCYSLFIESFMPKRHSKHSAGYDFRSAGDYTIPPSNYIITENNRMYGIDKPIKIATGIKVYMEDDDVLILYNRSSNPKKGLVLANNGIIDSDYVDNSDNEGEIMFQFWNFSDEPIKISLGDRIGQGIFHKYLITDDDTAEGERIGGFGSTGV